MLLLQGVGEGPACTGGRNLGSLPADLGAHRGMQGSYPTRPQNHPKKDCADGLLPFPLAGESPGLCVHFSVVSRDTVH